MNRVFKKPRLIIAILIFALCLIDLATAGESRSISISIVIPEIPGVNAPVIEENTIQTKIQATAMQQNAHNLEGENKSESPETIQEDEEKEIQLAENKDKSVVMVKTIYSR